MNNKPYKGVYYDKRMGKWFARICINGKQIHLGYFDYFEDAVIARKDAERRKQNGEKEN